MLPGMVREMPLKLYVCWGTFPVPWPRNSGSWRPAAHPCKVAHDALLNAGHKPAVTRTYGFGFLPDLTPGRRQVNRLTGQSYVPVLELEDGTTIEGSEQIAAWAHAHPG